MIGNNFAQVVLVVCVLIATSNVCPASTSDVEYKYPNNIGIWKGWNGFSPPIKLNGAIRILVPALLQNGDSRTFPLDIPPHAVANQFGLDQITLSWEALILDTGELVENEFSITFGIMFDDDGNPVWFISSLSVTYFNGQFLQETREQMISHTVEDLRLFPAHLDNSIQCAQAELKVTLDTFHVHLFDAQWQSFESGFDDDDPFRSPHTPNECARIVNQVEEYEFPDFWKLWIIITVVILAICLAVLGLLVAVSMFCLKKCREKKDEGYETFA